MAISNSLLGGISEDEAGPSGDERRQDQFMVNFLLNIFQAKVVFLSPQVMRFLLYKISDLCDI